LQLIEKKDVLNNWFPRPQNHKIQMTTFCHQ